MNKQQHIKVFMADDHPLTIYGVSCFLSKHPAIEIVGSAHSGMELTRKMPQTLPTILLLDLNMPGSDFYENIAWVKKHSPWVKIIVYSSYHTTELVKSLFAEGVSGYVSKQARPDELVETIESVVDGNETVVPPANAQSDNVPDPAHSELPDDFRKRLGLSKREQQVLELISRGLSSQSIGKTLYISKHTVETHRKNILRKLDFNSSTELVKFAVQQGLV